MCIRVLRQVLFGEGIIVPSVRAWYPVMLTGLPVCSVGIHDAKKRVRQRKSDQLKLKVNASLKTRERNQEQRDSDYSTRKNPPQQDAAIIKAGFREAQLAPKNTPWGDGMASMGLLDWFTQTNFL